MTAQQIQKRLGIIGGLGPEASCKFCLNVNRKFKAITNNQPDMVIENLPVPSHVEEKIIKETSEEMFNLLTNAVIRLNNSEVDFIAIPCNTVHIFIDQLRKVSKVPILSIIEECAKECKKRSLNNIGVLATTKSIQDKLHVNELKNNGINVLLPTQENQKKINEIILQRLHNENNQNNKLKLLNIINELKNNGAEAIILGCTELSLLIPNNDFNIPFLDSCAVLEDSAINKLVSNI